MRTDFQSQLLLELLGNGVLDEPAIELLLRVSDLGAVLVLEGQLVSVVLPEDGIAVEHILLGDTHGDDLVLFADICEEQSGPKNFSANKLAVVDDIGANWRGQTSSCIAIFR